MSICIWLDVRVVTRTTRHLAVLDARPERIILPWPTAHDTANVAVWYDGHPVGASVDR